MWCLFSTIEHNDVLLDLPDFCSNYSGSNNGYRDYPCANSMSEYIEWIYLQRKCKNYPRMTSVFGRDSETFNVCPNRFFVVATLSKVVSLQSGNEIFSPNIHSFAKECWHNESKTYLAYCGYVTGTTQRRVQNIFSILFSTSWKI